MKIKEFKKQVNDSIDVVEVYDSIKDNAKSRLYNYQEPARHKNRLILTLSTSISFVLVLLVGVIVISNMNLSEKSFSSDQPIGDKNTGNYQSDPSISADDKLNEKLYSYYLEKAQEPNSNMIGDLKEEEVVTIKETIIGIDKQSSETGEIPQTFSLELGNQICSDSNISSLYINDVENIYIYLKENNIEEDK